MPPSTHRTTSVSHGHDSEEEDEELELLLLDDEELEDGHAPGVTVAVTPVQSHPAGPLHVVAVRVPPVQSMSPANETLLASVPAMTNNAG